LTPTRAGFEYTLHPLDVRSDDLNAISNNPDHICKPVLRPHVPRPFVLPLHRNLRYFSSLCIEFVLTRNHRYFRLLEKDCCLVAVETTNSIEIYLETINNLAPAIENEKPTKRFYLEKIGKFSLFAVDETKKRLVLVSIQGVRANRCSKDIESDTAWTGLHIVAPLCIRFGTTHSLFSRQCD
jgi:hypothetical protein